MPLYILIGSGHTPGQSKETAHCKIRHHTSSIKRDDLERSTAINTGINANIVCEQNANQACPTNSNFMQDIYQILKNQTRREKVYIYLCVVTKAGYPQYSLNVYHDHIIIQVIW